MKQVYKFLKELSLNNNRDWFQAHKEEYLRAKSTFDEFVQKLIAEIHKFDKEILPERLSVKDCTYRIYRDIRFSKDKSPYKTHFGAYFTKGGKKSQFGGYYFHIEPLPGQFSLGNLMCAGAYMPTAKQIASVRDEISVNSQSILDAIKKARGFTLDEEDALRRTPRGFEDIKNPDAVRLLKLKSYLVVKHITPEYIFAPNLVKRAATDFKKCYEFNHLINKCIEYSMEESNY